MRMGEATEPGDEVTQLTCDSHVRPEACGLLRFSDEETEAQRGSGHQATKWQSRGSQGSPCSLAQPAAPTPHPVRQPRAMGGERSGLWVATGPDPNP